jgi:hypothetical protein
MSHAQTCPTLEGSGRAKSGHSGPFNLATRSRNLKPIAHISAKGFGRFKGVERADMRVAGCPHLPAMHCFADEHCLGLRGVGCHIHACGVVRGSTDCERRPFYTNRFSVPDCLRLAGIAGHRTGRFTRLAQAHHIATIGQLELACIGRSWVAIADFLASLGLIVHT